VHAFINGVEMSLANVDAQGKYRLTFKYKDSPAATELRVLPAKLSHLSAHAPAFRKSIGPG